MEREDNKRRQVGIYREIVEIFGFLTASFQGLTVMKVYEKIIGNAINSCISIQ